MDSNFQLSPEVALISACCRWPRSLSRVDAIRRAGAASIDWQRFMLMTRKHRVDPLVHDGLLASELEFPEEIREGLQGRSLQIGSRSLLQAGITVAVSNLFRAAGIRALFVKGSTLERLAYGEVGLKLAHDIDVLVERADVAAASDIIRGAGWKRVIPPPDLRDDLLEPFLDRCKDVSFVHPEHGFYLELHHRLAEHESLDEVRAASASQEVEVLPGRSVPTLANDELFTYLTVHGGFSQWARLKWLADLAGLLSSSGCEEIGRLYDAACRRGAGRFAGQALLLCHRLLEIPVPQAVHVNLQSDRRVQRLCAHALAAMEQALPHKAESLAAVARGYWLQIQMGTSWRSRAARLRRYWVSPTDMAVFPLPRRLMFLYLLGRVPFFILRRGLGLGPAEPAKRWKPPEEAAP